MLVFAERVTYYTLYLHLKISYFFVYFQPLRNLDYFAAELIRIKMVPRVLPWH